MEEITSEFAAQNTKIVYFNPLFSDLFLAVP